MIDETPQNRRFYFTIDQLTFSIDESISIDRDMKCLTISKFTVFEYNPKILISSIVDIFNIDVYPER